MSVQPRAVGCSVLDEVFGNERELRGEGKRGIGHVTRSDLGKPKTKTRHDSRVRRRAQAYRPIGLSIRDMFLDAAGIGASAYRVVLRTKAATHVPALHLTVRFYNIMRPARIPRVTASVRVDASSLSKIEPI